MAIAVSLALAAIAHSQDLGSAKSRPRGGATFGRGACPFAQVPLTALIANLPPEKSIAGQSLDATVADHPTFWFYVPYSPELGLTAEFSLTDADGNEIYTTTIPLKDQPGVIGIPVPPDKPILKEGQEYQWLFSVICNPSDPSAQIITSGVIDRVPLNPEVKAQLELASSLREKAVIYKNNGLWFDALTSLALLRRQNLKDSTLKADWENLFQSMNLTSFATQQLTPCCSMNKIH